MKHITLVVDGWHGLSMISISLDGKLSTVDVNVILNFRQVLSKGLVGNMVCDDHGNHGDQTRWCGDVV